MKTPSLALALAVALLPSACTHRVRPAHIRPRSAHMPTYAVAVEPHVVGAALAEEPMTFATKGHHYEVDRLEWTEQAVTLFQEELRRRGAEQAETEKSIQLLLLRADAALPFSGVRMAVDPRATTGDGGVANVIGQAESASWPLVTGESMSRAIEQLFADPTIRAYLLE